MSSEYKNARFADFNRPLPVPVPVRCPLTRRPCQRPSVGAPSADISRNDTPPESIPSVAIAYSELPYAGAPTIPIKFNNKMTPPIFFNFTPLVLVGWVERIIPKPFPAPIHRPNFRAMTLAKFAERNPTFLKPPAFPTNSHTIARFQIPNLPFHVSIALLLMFADSLPGRLKNVGLKSTNQQRLKPQYQRKHIQPLIIRSTAQDAYILLVGWVGIN